MAISTEQTARGTNGTAQTFNVTFGSTPTQGNLLIAALTHDETSPDIATLTSSGWVRQATYIGAGSVMRCSVWAKFAGAGEATVVAFDLGEINRRAHGHVVEIGNAAITELETVDSAAFVGGENAAATASNQVDSPLEIRSQLIGFSITGLLGTFTDGTGAYDVLSLLDDWSNNFRGSLIGIVEGTGASLQPDASWTGARTNSQIFVELGITPPVPGIRIEVNDVDVTDKWMRAASTGWEDPLNGRGTGSIQFGDVAGGFTPEDGQSFAIIDSGVKAFAGILMEPTQTEIEGSGFIFYDCVLADFNILADRRFVGETYEEQALELIVSGIVTDHMDGEGITLGGVEAGPELEETAFANISATEAFNSLSDATGRAWYIDPDRVMNFRERTSVSAPAALDGDTLLMGTVSVREDRQKYRNEQIVRAGTEEFPILAVSGDATEQAARAAIEGTSGIYTNIVDKPEILNADVALEFAADLLERFARITKVVTGTTRTPGFHAGQSAVVDLPNHGINSETMLVESVHAEVINVEGVDEIWYAVTAITGDPFGGWMEHFRKAPPVKGVLRFQNNPGLFKVPPIPGVLVHDPEPDDLEFFQGAASGVLDYTPSSIALKPDGSAMVTLRRVASPAPAQTVLEVWPNTDFSPATSPSSSVSFNEVGTSNYKQGFLIDPRGTMAAYVQPDTAPLFVVATLLGGAVGSCVSTMSNNSAAGEPLWLGNFVYWPDTLTANLHVFDVTTPGTPTEISVLATSLSAINSVCASSDGAWLYAAGGTDIISIDLTDPANPVEDTVLAVGGTYISLDINEFDDLIFAFRRSGAGDVAWAAIDVAGGTITLNTEDSLSLATSTFEGRAVIVDSNRAIAFSEDNPSGSTNILEAHVFDVTDPTAVSYLETFNYNHAASGNVGPLRELTCRCVLYTFGFNTDAQITYGEIQYKKIAPISIDNPLRAGFGGTGIGSYFIGDLIFAGEDVPTDRRYNGELSTLPIGDEGEALFVSSGVPAWGPVRNDFFNGSFLETFDALVTSDGATVTMSLEQSGGGNLTMRFSDGWTELATDPAATLVLTAGSDASPQENFVYIPKSTKVLTLSTSSFPTSEEHIKVAYFLVPSATFVQASGCYVNQNWNDHAAGTDGQGHMAHMAERSRRLGAEYFSGIDGNGTTGYITIGAGSPNTVDFISTAGVIYQMHRHAVDAIDMSAGDTALVVNDSVTPYDEIADLNVLLTDAAGGSMSGRYFNLVFWGVGNKGGEFAPLMVNLPGGSYTSQALAEADQSGYDDFSMPAAFNRESSTGFLICRVTLKHSPAGGGTWTHIGTVDLRGLTPATAAGGGGTSSLTQFPDNSFRVFDESDVTKLMAFEVAGITTGTTRTYNAPDADGTLVLAESAETIAGAWEFSAGIITANATGVSIDDSGGTPREVLSVDGSNITFIGSESLSGDIVFRTAYDGEHFVLDSAIGVNVLEGSLLLPSGGIGVSGSSTFGGAVDATHETAGISSSVIASLGAAHTATGTINAGHGTAVNYRLDDTAHNLDIAGRSDVVWTVPTSGAESADFVIRLMNAGAAIAEKFRVTSAGHVEIEGGIILADGGSGATADRIGIYNTDDGTNAELGEIWWASNVFRIGTSATGTGTARAIGFDIGGTNLIQIESSGIVGIGSSVNGFQTVGLTIDQGTNDDEILSLKSDDIAHGITTITDTETFGLIAKFAGGTGGVSLAGFSEATQGLEIYGTCTTTDTTKGTAGVAPVMIRSAKKSGTTRGTFASDENICVWREVNQARMILDQEGDLWLDSTATVSAHAQHVNEFDEFDDIAVLSGFRGLTYPGGDRAAPEFLSRWIDYARPILEAGGIVRFNSDGHHFVSLKRLHALEIDAIRQLSDRIAELEMQLAQQRA